MHKFLDKVIKNIDPKKTDFDGAIVKTSEFVAVQKDCEKAECKGCKNCPPVKISGYASTFGNTDRENDVIASSAFEKHKKEIKGLPILMDHSNKCSDVIGKITSFEIDSKGLKINCDMAKMSDRKEVTHTLQMIEKGIINKFSIGGLFKYRPRKANDNNWTIEEIRLTEVSVVAVPANEKAEFQMVNDNPEPKAMGGVDVKSVLLGYRKRMKSGGKKHV